MKILERFFAITKTSLYRITAEQNAPDCWLPKVVKTALRLQSNFPVGRELSQRDMLSIGRQLIMFTPEGSGWVSPMVSTERDISQVNTRWWGEVTSCVAGLFLHEDEALQQFENADTLKFPDPRFLEQTTQVLSAIGDNHPVFSIAKFEGLKLLPGVK